MSIIGDYSKCKIYKIISLGNPELVYYGNTIQTLSKRFIHHKNSSSTYSKQIIDKGDAIIELVEDYPCENVMQARLREAEYILNNECVNRNVPGRSRQDSMKAYCKSNKEKILELAKQYREKADKEKLNEYSRQYREENQDELKEKRMKKFEEKKIL